MQIRSSYWKQIKSIQDLSSNKQEEPLTAQPLSTKNVLLVDDSIINLKLMKEVSSRLGATPYLASDGQEAIDVFSSTSIDLIFIDQNMPVVNGIEAIKKIRSLPNGKKVKIYGLTGDTDTNIHNKMIDAGANAILHKPIQINELRKILTSQ